MKKMIFVSEDDLVPDNAQYMSTRGNGCWHVFLVDEDYEPKKKKEDRAPLVMTD